MTLHDASRLNRQSIRPWDSREPKLDVRVACLCVNNPFLPTVAEREGFEPSVEILSLRRFSKPLPSATRPPLHVMTLRGVRPYYRRKVSSDPGSTTRRHLTSAPGKAQVSGKSDRWKDSERSSQALIQPLK